MKKKISQTLEELQCAGRTLIDTWEAAAILSMRPQTLYKWSCYQNGPISSVHVGGSVKWRLTDIAKHIGGSKH